jgi:hypothetical protein
MSHCQVRKLKRDARDVSEADKVVSVVDEWYS